MADANAQADTTNWYGLIMNAQRAGYTTRKDEDGLWWVVTPARPRRPSEELGAYVNERAAWHGAALLAYQESTPMT